MPELKPDRPVVPADLVQAQLARLRQKYGLALPAKISGIQAAIAPLFAGAWSEPACEAAHRMVHSLAGSSGTYGFPGITGVAREAEAILKAGLESHTTPQPDQKARMDALMASLRDMAADAARQEAE